jgi:hypothetical protein
MTLNTVNRLNQISKNITSEQLTAVAFPVFVKNTPVRSGNARRHTTKTANEIDASYPYAQRLDHGWSRQSPNGMVKPTVQAVRDYIRTTLGA